MKTLTKLLLVVSLLLAARPSTATTVTMADLHSTVDAAFTYGIGGYGALGVQLHPTGQLEVWKTRRATGSFDFGLVLGFQSEPQFLQYGINPGQSNDAQRLNAWVTVGHTFHLGVLRKVGLGLHVFNGWTHVWSQAAVRDPAHGIDRRVTDNYGLFNTGALVKFDYRFSKYVGFNLQAAAPFPVGASYVNTLFHVGVGLTGYLR